MALERVDGAGAEGVSDDLSLATMLCAVAHVEDTWDARDKGLVVDAGLWSEDGGSESSNGFLLFQESVPVSIDCVQAFRFCNRDMVVPNSDNRSIRFVCPVNPGKLLAASGTESQPGVAESSQPWSRDAS